MSTNNSALLTGLRQQMIGVGLHDLAQQVKGTSLTHSASLRELAKHRLSLAFSQPGFWGQVRDLLLTLVQPMLQAGHRQDWLYYLAAGIDSCQRSGDLHTEAILRYHLAELYRLMTEYEQANQQYTWAAELSAQVEDNQLTGQVLSHHAFLACTQRNFALAQQLVDRARTLLDSTTASEECAYCDLVEGGIAFFAKEWQQTIDFCDHAIQCWQQIGNQEMMAQCRSNQGYAYQALGNVEQAHHCYQQAVTIFEQVNNPYRLAIALLNWGLLKHNQQLFQDALQMYSRAEKLCLQTGDKLNLANCYNNQGEAYRQLCQWQYAIDAYHQALQTFHAIDNVAGEVNTFDNMAIVLIEQQRYRDAQNILMSAITLLNSIPNDPNFHNLSKTIYKKLNFLDSMQSEPVTTRSA